jgi:DNA-binding HxlR family transcriptional regulator
MAEKSKKIASVPCPLACSLDLIGDKWTLLVVRDLFLGRKHFKDFEASPEGIATNILANRLGRLVDEGLAEKFPSPEQKGRAAYRLTDRGKSLEPVVQAIADWGLAQIAGTRIGLQ